MNSCIKKKIIILTNKEASDYPRYIALIKILQNNYNVQEIDINHKENKIYFSTLLRVFQQGIKSDFVILTHFLTHFVSSFSCIPTILLFKIFFRNKIILDFFNSVYETRIIDKAYIQKGSIRATYYYLVDYLACKMAHIIFFDTKGHQEFFSKFFKIKKDKHKIVLPVIIDTQLLHSIKSNNILPKDEFNVFFYGSFIPLQGIEYIVKAAFLLKENEKINFIILGSGHVKKDIDKLHNKLNINNISFIDRVSYNELIGYIKSSDICLGIFGNTDKAQRVIPNKLLECMACEKIVVTGKNNDMAMYFKDKEDLIYCNMADEKDLAEKIEYVYNNFYKLKYIEKNAKSKIDKYFSIDSVEKIIVENLI